MSHNDDTPLESRLLRGTEDCVIWEAALVDLLDGTLAPDDEAALRAHASRCATCQALLEESSHGRAWARLLHDTPPVVPEALLGRILTKTTGDASGAARPGGPGASVMPGVLLPSGDMLVLPAAPVWALHGQKQARIVMTAAMAFFSIALTLSISGVRLGDIHNALHAPATFEATATRQFFDTKKQVVSFYDNLRLVREVEATVDDLRHSGGRDAHARQQAPQPSANRLPAFPFTAAPLLASREADRENSTNNDPQAQERNIL